MITKLQKNIKVTSSFIHESARLWETHTKRKEQIELTVLKELRQVIAKNDKTEEVNFDYYCVLT